MIAAVGEDIIQTYKGNPKAYGSSLIKRGIGGEIQESVKNLFNKLLPQFGSLITLKQRNPSFISALNALNGNIPTTQINNTYTIGDINLTTDATDGKTFATEFIDHFPNSLFYDSHTGSRVDNRLRNAKMLVEQLKLSEIGYLGGACNICCRREKVILADWPQNHIRTKQIWISV